MADQFNWNSLTDAYGLSQQDVISLKGQGYTPDQVNQLLSVSIGGGGSSTGQGGLGSGGNQSGPGSLPTIGGSGLSPSMLIRLASALKGAGGSGGAQQTGPPTSGVDPNQELTNLGAAALNERASYPPVPGSDTDPVSGVSKGTQGTVSDVVPAVQQGPWTRTPGVFVSATGQVQPGTKIQNPMTVGTGVDYSKVPAGSPKGTKPQILTAPTQMSNFNPIWQPGQPSTTTITPTQQPTGMAFTPGQAWAQAPAAPGIQVAPQQMPAPMGRAMPPVAPSMAGAQPSPYTGTVHNDPFMSNAVSKLMGLASNPWHPDGSSTMTASPTRPIKMSSGGWVPGDPNDNSDSVSAQLSPGEFVVPKKQASETVHAPISTQSLSSYSPPPAPTGQSSQQSTQSPAASTHTNVGAGNETIANLGKLFAGNKGFTTDPSTGTIYDPNREVYESAGSGFTTKGGALYDPQGNVYESNPAAGAGGGVVSPQVGGAISGGIGAIGSAIQSALNSIAQTSWKPQPSAIPSPSSFKRNTPSYNFTAPNA